MKKKYPVIFQFFAAALLISLLAACASLTPPDSTQPTTASTEAAPQATLPPTSVSTPETTSEATASEPTATIEPYVLEGATTTQSGLQILDVTAGTGASPKNGDLISLHFTGTLLDGTEFVNTISRPKPVYMVYGQDQLMPGLDEGLSLMKAGGEAKMVLPPELAFGAQGYGAVPPNSQIILDVQLISVEKPPQPTQVAEADLTTTDSGLQYTDLTVGDGTEVEANDVVSNNFTIWVQGDTEDQYITSSLGNDPLSFQQGAGDTVFKGWEEGVLGMKVGGKRLLVVPPDLALGEAGGNGIPGNATLIMEVDVTDVRKPPEMTKVPDGDYTTTASGLKYYDIVVGEGDTPTTGQTVVVDYTGWLEDGTQFDSSVVRGTPFSFTLGTGSVIPGWDEGVATMKVGGKRQLVVPADLAYGDTGAGGVIPPGATLIFDVELLDIQP